MVPSPCKGLTKHRTQQPKLNLARRSRAGTTPTLLGVQILHTHQQQRARYRSYSLRYRGYEELNNNGCLLFVAMTHGGMPSPVSVLAPGGIADSLPDRVFLGRDELRSTQTLGGEQQILFVSEPGFYNCLRKRSPVALLIWRAARGLFSKQTL